MRRFLQRMCAVTTAVALVVAVPTATLLAAEVDTDESSLCDAITLAEIHALSPLRFEEPSGGSAFGGTYCQFGSPPAEAEFYNLGLGLSGLATVELARAQLPGGLDLTVAGRPAYLVERPDNVPPSVQLLVDLGPESLSVQVGVPEAQPGLDQTELVIAIAEVAASRLLDAAASDTGLPPSAESSVNLVVRSEATGQDVTGPTDGPSFAPWKALLEITGADIEQLRQFNADIVQVGTDEPVGQSTTIQVVGADPELFKAGLDEFLRVGLGEEAMETEDATIGSKEVTVLRVGDEVAYLHVSGDNAHLLTAPEDVIAVLLELGL